MCRQQKHAIVESDNSVFLLRKISINDQKNTVRRELMKTKKACIWILMTALMVSLLAGCFDVGAA